MKAARSGSRYAFTSVQQLPQSSGEEATTGRAKFSLDAASDTSGRDSMSELESIASLNIMDRVPGLRRIFTGGAKRVEIHPHATIRASRRRPMSAQNVASRHALRPMSAGVTTRPPSASTSLGSGKLATTPGPTPRQRPASALAGSRGSSGGVRRGQEQQNPTGTNPSTRPTTAAGLRSVHSPGSLPPASGKHRNPAPRRTTTGAGIRGRPTPPRPET